MIQELSRPGGRLEIVCGPMFSGKTEELMRRLRRAEIAGQRVLIVKPRIDDRYGLAEIVSHAGVSMRAVVVGSAGEILRRSPGHDVIGIDEVQFFEPEVVDVVRELVRRGLRVITAGLDMDFRGHPFGSVPTLMSIAELVDKVQAVCHRCGGVATRTQRLVDGRPAPFSDATVQVGARDAYEARCTGCYEPGRPVDLADATRKAS